MFIYSSFFRQRDRINSKAQECWESARSKENNSSSSLLK